MSREYFSSDPSRPFADAVLIDGKTLYLSGRIGLIPGTTTVPETAEEEAHLVLQEVQRVLAMAGMRMDHLVSLQVFCSDVSLWERFNAVYRGLLRRAVATAGVSWFGNAAVWCAV